MWMIWLDDATAFEWFGSIYWYLRKWKFIFKFVPFAASGYFLSGMPALCWAIEYIEPYLYACAFQLKLFSSSSSPSSFPFLESASQRTIEFDCLHCGRHTKVDRFKIMHTLTQSSMKTIKITPHQITIFFPLINVFIYIPTFQCRPHSLMRLWN